MANDISAVEMFEEKLDHGREMVISARKTYSTLHETQVIPEPLVEALGTLEREIEQLDETLDVSEQDIDQADGVSQRGLLLDETISSMGQRQRTVVEGDLNRLREFATTVKRLNKTTEAVHLDDQISDFEKQCSLCQKLADRGRHFQIRASERLDLGKLEMSIRQVEAEVVKNCSPTSFIQLYLQFADNLLDDIHDSLSALNNDNTDRMAYSTELRGIKQDLEDIEEADDFEGNDNRVSKTRVAVEGCLMLHFLTTRSVANQRVAEELAETVEKTHLFVECDVEACVNRGDAQAIVSAVTETIASQTEHSTSERVQRLLEDHDGNIVLTSQMSQFSVYEILDEVETLYNSDQIAEISVKFKS